MITGDNHKASDSQHHLSDQVSANTVQDAPDQQVSLTDPDARSMATSGKGTATVGYNVQIAVDAADLRQSRGDRLSRADCGPSRPRSGTGRFGPLGAIPGNADGSSG